MTRLRAVAIAALVAAIPIEILNARLADAMFDPGSGPTDWGSILLAYQWGILHFPGLVLISLESLESYRWTWNWLLFGSGYLDTALLLMAIILGFGWLQRSIVRLIHRPNRPVTHRSAG